MRQKLTTNDAAKILNRAAGTVLYYEKLGKLRAERTQSGIRLFDRSDVERLAHEITKKEISS